MTWQDLHDIPYSRKRLSNKYSWKVILEEIQKFAKDNQEVKFEPGYITIRVLKGLLIKEDMLVDLPDSITIYEMKTIIRKYLSFSVSDHFDISIEG